MSAYRLNDAYDYCLRLAQQHYENFPVASRLLPRQQRRAVAVIYAFARTADDIADEGEATPEQRLEQLSRYGAQLDLIDKRQTPDDPVFIALADVIDGYQLPLQLFHDLLSAFRQDVTQKRYANVDEVLDYCRRSANPVGRLLLHLNGEAVEEKLVASDHICSALQLINFMQDLQQDYHENNRVYLPQDEMRRFGVTEETIASADSNEKMQALIDFQLERIAQMLSEGKPLGTMLHGRFGLEIRLIIAAAQLVTEKLKHHQGDVFSRPRLRKRDYVKILLQALFYSRNGAR